MAIDPRFVAAAGIVAAADALALYSTRDRYTAQDQSVTFPTDLSNAYIHMRFTTYSRRSIQNQAFFDPRQTVAIRLPIPSKLVDTTSLNYEKTSLGPLMGASADAAAAIGEASPFNVDRLLNENPLAALTTRLNALRQSAGVAVGGAAQIAQRAAGPDALSAVASVTGMSINPYQTTTFKTPNFKTHNFSWKLAPKNKDESNRIEKIIRLFKYHSLPATSFTGVFFAMPNVLQIKLFPEDQYLYKFKPCVVESVTVNYAPNGPSFYRDTNAPTAVDISLQLQEIELWTKLDYLGRDSASGNVPLLNFQPELNPSPGA